MGVISMQGKIHILVISYCFLYRENKNSIIQHQSTTDRRLNFSSVLLLSACTTNQPLSPLLCSERSMLGGWVYETRCGFAVVIATEWTPLNQSLYGVEELSFHPMTEYVQASSWPEYPNIRTMHAVTYMESLPLCMQASNSLKSCNSLTYILYRSL